MRNIPNLPVMKTMRALLLGLGLLAYPAGLLALGPHPSLLRIKVGKEYHPVIGLSGGDPVYWDGKTEVRYRQKAEYDISRTDRFASATVEISNASGEPDFKTGFDLTLVASETIKDGFIVVVMYVTDFTNEISRPYTQHVVRPLPELPAGVKVKVSIPTNGIPLSPKAKREPKGKHRYFPLVFTAGGLEARTNQWADSAKYFRFLEDLKFIAVFERYLEKFASSNHAATPFIQIPPFLPEGAARPAGPINAIISINVSGMVTDVKLPDEIPADFATSLREALGDWRFLPRLKAGQPVPCKVEVPVQF